MLDALGTLFGSLWACAVRLVPALAVILLADAALNVATNPLYRAAHATAADFLLVIRVTTVGALISLALWWAQGGWVHPFPTIVGGSLGFLGGSSCVVGKVLRRRRLADRGLDSGYRWFLRPEVWTLLSFLAGAMLGMTTRLVQAASQAVGPSPFDWLDLLQGAAIGAAAGLPVGVGYTTGWRRGNQEPQAPRSTARALFDWVRGHGVAGG